MSQAAADHHTPSDTHQGVRATYIVIAQQQLGAYLQLQCKPDQPPVAVPSTIISSISVLRRKRPEAAGLIHSWPSNSTTTMVLCMVLCSLDVLCVKLQCRTRKQPAVRTWLCLCVCRRKIMHAAVRRRDRMHACSAVQGQETRVQTEYVVLHRLHPVSSSSSSCLRVSSHPPPEFEAGCS
jgi:hypothetical protein